MACGVPDVPSLPIAFWRSVRETSRRMMLRWERTRDEEWKWQDEGKALDRKGARYAFDHDERDSE
jgi:hypothetical protein